MVSKEGLTLIQTVIEAMERGWLPDAAIRGGIHHLCAQRLKPFHALTPEQARDAESRYRDALRQSPVAVNTDDANKQHYELPPEFFTRVMGKNLKYSSGFWSENCNSLDESEDAALEETCRRAELKDGQRILELGCGWGSLTLTMARKYPNAHIVAISNSAPQRLFIEARAKERGLTNIQILTRNMANVIELEKEFPPFDRAVSVEMFEHMKNYETLLARISKWLAPDGKLFVHIFTHKDYSYPFETDGDDNWMGKYFFTGGQMPAHHLLGYFQKDLMLEQDWSWSGAHYSKTSRAWVDNMDKHRRDIINIFADLYGPSEALRWFQRWRIFFMACEVLFGYANGTEWGVSHYRFINRRMK